MVCCLGEGEQLNEEIVGFLGEFRSWFFWLEPRPTNCHLGCLLFYLITSLPTLEFCDKNCIFYKKMVSP